MHHDNSLDELQAGGVSVPFSQQYRIVAAQLSQKPQHTKPHNFDPAASLAREVHDLFGGDELNKTVLTALCTDLGIVPVPSSNKKCKEVCRTLPLPISPQADLARLYAMYTSTYTTIYNRSMTSSLCSRYSKASKHSVITLYSTTRSFRRSMPKLRRSYASCCARSHKSVMVESIDDAYARLSDSRRQAQ